jgi:hypothetical protein
MIEAFLLAERISSYPQLSCLLVCPPGLERIELALAIANERELVTLPAPVGGDLAAAVLRAYEFGVTNTVYPAKPSVLYISDAHRLNVREQHFIAQLTYRAPVIVAVDIEHVGNLHRGLLDTVVGNAITIPPLNKRKADLAPVALSWVSGLRPAISIEKVSQEVWDILQGRDWPSTEMLTTAIEHAAIAASNEGSSSIELRHLPPEAIQASPHGWLDIPLGKGWTLQRLTDAYVLHSKARLHTVNKGHRLLGMSRSGYQKRLARLTGRGQDPDRQHRGTPREKPRPQLVTNPAHRWANCGKERQPDKGISRPFGSRRFTPGAEES